MKATYQEIKDYVLKEFDLKVSNLYISQIKRKCGIEVGENYNLPKTENPKVPQCPKEKEDATIRILSVQMKNRITEELKARDQMVWIGAVNNIQNAAEEIVLKELIYT